MELGFETIGNATLICHDRTPVLVTDPWIDGPAYFGSWTLSHEIPDRLRESTHRCRYVAISHGHPDHLSAESMLALRGKTILLPDHVGQRVYKGLAQDGYDVRILPNRRWVQLSERVRVLCIADYNQDGIFLVDVGGTLVINLNDASDRGWGRFVRATAARFKVAFLLKLSGYGDADMIHLFDESGRRIARPKPPVGRQIVRAAHYFRARYAVPFSSMHKYQRSDSIWAEEYTTQLDDYGKGFASPSCELLPAFIRYDVLRDEIEPINPREARRRILSPKDFGDDWSVPLEAGDAEMLTSYFRGVDHVRESFDFIRFQVGGREHTIDLGRGTGRGLTFAAPRTSLMAAVQYEVFDDMLIGNFMKTTLHGEGTSLYPDFTPFVAKYGDNGRARTREDLEAYFQVYRRRAPFDHFVHQMENRSVNVFRSFLPEGSLPRRAVAGVYRRLKGIDPRRAHAR